MTKTESRNFDLNWIKEHLGIEPGKQTAMQAWAMLQEHKINTTSWVLDRLNTEYGHGFAAGYRLRIKGKTCEHGFIGSCPYCKWGTE